MFFPKFEKLKCSFIINYFKVIQFTIKEFIILNSNYFIRNFYSIMKINCIAIKVHLPQLLFLQDRSHHYYYCYYLLDSHFIFKVIKVDVKLSFYNCNSINFKLIEFIKVSISYYRQM